MAVNYKLGLLTAAVLAACNAEDTYNSKTNDSEKLPDKNPPAVELKVHLIDGPTYHPTLSVKVDDYDKLIDDYLANENDSEYVLSKDGKVNPKSKFIYSPELIKNSSNLKEVILYEDGKPIITRRSTPENEMYGSDYFSADLEHEDGEYVYEAKAVDNAGNNSASSPLVMVFKKGYALPKEDLANDKTPPRVTFYDESHTNSTVGKFCANVYELSPNDTRIVEVTLLKGDKVVANYNPKKDHTLASMVISSDNICLTDVPYAVGMFTSHPNLGTLAAVKDVVVVAKDFAGNETRVAYSETEEFKQLEEYVKDLEKLNSGSGLSREDILKRFIINVNNIRTF